DRLRAVHSRGAAGRARARRPLVVGDRRQAGMRAARPAQPRLVCAGGARHHGEHRIMSALSHLDWLEAESIHVMREVAAECDKAVMLFSIGKDSAVMLHLAMKAFYPGKPPFPLLHIDTTWKFREMIAFRDRRARELGVELLVHTNQDGVA